MIYKLESMVTPSVHGAGFATSGYSANFGPAYGTSSPADAALFGILYAGQGRSDVAQLGHFLRDSIERRSDVEGLRSEIRQLKNGDPEKEALKAQVAALRDAALIAAVKEAVKPPAPAA